MHKKGCNILTDINRIKTLAKERGVSLAFLCKKMGVARVYFIDFVKQGRSDIPTDKLKVIADTLNTSVAYLQGEIDEKEIDTNNVSLDDFTYAMHGASGKLTDRDKKIVMSLVQELVDANTMKEKNADNGKAY